MAISTPAHAAQKHSTSVSFSGVSHPDLESMDGVFAIAQDKQGFIWFGGKNGLRRFDGYKVDVFRNTPGDAGSLGSNDISDILVDSAGRLWVALLSGGGLNQFDYESETFIHYKKDVSSANNIGSMDIYALAEDDNGDLWMATSDNGLNRLEHSTGYFHRYPIALPGTEDSGVRGIAIDTLGNIWAATNSHGLYKINTERDQFLHYPHKAGDSKSLSGDELYKIYIDRHEKIWVGTKNGGLNRFDQSKGQFIHYKPEPSNSGPVRGGRIFDIIEDADGYLWVASNNSLSRYNPWQNTFESFPVDHYGVNALSGTVSRMFLDASGDLWLGTLGSKIHRVSRYAKGIQVISHNPVNTNSLSGRVVNGLGEDSKGNIWVGTNKGLTRVSANGQKYDHFPVNTVMSSGQTLDVDSDIQNVLIDNKDNIWITSTRGVGIYDTERKQHNIIDFGYTFGSSVIRHVVEDKQGLIWFATEEKGLISYDPETEKIAIYFVSHLDDTSLSHRFVWSILEDSRGDLWVGTLWGLNKLDRASGKFVRYYHDSDNVNSLSNNSVRAIAEDKQGDLWLGTNSGLSRFNIKKESFDVFRVKDGLADDNISSVLVDEKDHVWITNQKGISKFDRITNKFKNYDTRHGIASNSHTGKTAVLVKRDGRLLFSSAEGITVIKPELLSSNQSIPPVVLTRFFIKSNEVKVLDKSVLSKPISLTESVNLSHRQNEFSIEFSALNYHYSELNTYEYKLVGYDKDWKPTNSQKRLANYTNLDPGSYTFLVKGSNNEGQWNPNPTQLHIHISSPWWFTNLALALYFIGVFILMILLYRVLKKQSEKNTIKNKKLKSLDKLKQQFLSNVSREITLPLNTIIGLTDNILDYGAGEISEKIRQHVLLINDNTEQLVALTRDMLDFSEINADGFQINRRLLYLEPILQGVVKWFQPLAEKKSLKLYLSIEGDLPELEADYSCIQKILFNIIDNAIKNTDHGYVDVLARQSENTIIIQIADTGTGIEKQECEALFSDSDVEIKTLGMNASEDTKQEEKQSFTEASEETYTGLIYTKTLVELHGGKIYVDSTSDKGSMFVIRLPLEYEYSIDSE